MIQLPDSHDNNRTGDDAAGRQPEVVLLNEKQWSYVQSRYDLTPREREIAELICQGFHNGKIASVLCIRPGTVKTHTRNIYRKVHVKSKIGMLLRFVTDTRGFFTQYDGISPLSFRRLATSALSACYPIPLQYHAVRFPGAAPHNN